MVAGSIAPPTMADELLERLQSLIPGSRFEMVALPLPGGCEPARRAGSPGTGAYLAELDQAVLAGSADCAVHCAAGLPDESPPGIEYFRVPCGEGFGESRAEPENLVIGYRADDRRMLALRNLVIHPVILAGAGIGSAANTTLGALEAIRNCDVCLYDALLPAELTDYLPPTAASIPVGKRQGAHSVPQDEIGRLLVKYALGGARVVRLKGGDPAVFGRLVEETDLLQARQLPFRVLPGVGSYSVAAAACGILPARRGLARGFTIMAPRRGGSSAFEPLPPEERLRLPQIVYMGASVVPQLARQCLDEGFAPDTPVAVVFAAGTAEQKVVSSTLERAGSELAGLREAAPGLVCIGSIADSALRFKTHAPLENMRILYCGAASGASKAAASIQRYGGYCIPMPMIELRATAHAADIAEGVSAYDWLLITSPTCAQLFLATYVKAGLDLRLLPHVMVCGPGTLEPFQSCGIVPDLMPARQFGADGLIEALADAELAGCSVLRLQSNLADDRLTRELEKRGAAVEAVQFYENRPLNYDGLPDADAAVFTCASSVDAFAEQFGEESLPGKLVCAIGAPTAGAAGKLRGAEIVQAVQATIAGCVQTLAGRMTAVAIARANPPAPGAFCRPF